MLSTFTVLFVSDLRERSVVLVYVVTNFIAVVILASLVDFFADSLVLYYCTQLFVDQRILVAKVYCCTRCFSYSRRHGSKKRQRQTPKKLEDDDSKYSLFILIIAIISIYFNRDRATGGREIQILT